MSFSATALVVEPKRRRVFPAWAMAAGIAALFVSIVGYAKLQGYWNSEIPTAVYQKLVPHANEARHPMPGDPGISEQ